MLIEIPQKQGPGVSVGESVGLLHVLDGFHFLQIVVNGHAELQGHECNELILSELWAGGVLTVDFPPQLHLGSLDLLV